VFFQKELNRVMLHGLLHVLGYNDTEKMDKTLMSSKEDYYLALYDNI
jgi:probable rRNA maturation factor